MNTSRKMAHLQSGPQSLHFRPQSTAHGVDSVFAPATPVTGMPWVTNMPPVGYHPEQARLQLARAPEHLARDLSNADRAGLSLDLGVAQNKAPNELPFPSEKIRANANAFQLGKSTFMTNKNEIIQKIYQNPVDLGHSFGENFGKTKWARKEFSHQTRRPRAVDSGSPQANLISGSFKPSPSLGKREFFEFQQSGLTDRQRVPNHFENRTINNGQLNEDAPLPTHTRLALAVDPRRPPLAALRNVFARNGLTAQGLFPGAHMIQVKKPKMKLKSTISNKNSKTAHLSVVPLQMRSSEWAPTGPAKVAQSQSHAIPNKPGLAGASNTNDFRMPIAAGTAGLCSPGAPRESLCSTSNGESHSGAQEFGKTSILQAREEKLARDYNVGLIKLESRRMNQRRLRAKLKGQFEQIHSLDLASDLLIRPEPRGRLFQRERKEFMIQCGSCQCVVAKVDTARRNYFICTQNSRDVQANFKLANVSSIVNKSEAYPLESLKKVLTHMLLRQPIQPQMLDLNIFEIKLLHAVLVKRFKGSYLNSKIKLRKNHRKLLKSFGDVNSFAEFLESKRVPSGLKQGHFKDVINQKSIYFSEGDIEDIEKKQFTAGFLNVLIENEPLKRLEEQLKFVLSRAEQSLIVEYLKRHKQQTPEQIDKSLKTNRYQVEVEFYEEYFFEYAKCHRIPIEKFYFPRNKNKLVSNSHKTINKSYMGNITLNPDYVAKMTRHIRERLLRIEKDTIRVKINNKIEKWNSFLLRKLNFEREDRILAHFNDFINSNILENDKFKLPWSVKQIESAISTVLEQLR